MWHISNTDSSKEVGILGRETPTSWKYRKEGKMNNFKYRSTTE